MSILSSARYWSVPVASAITAILTLSTSASAATFSRVYSFLELTNFSKSPTTTLTNTEANTLVISSGGSAVAFSDALAVFDISESLAFNTIESFTGGNGRNYAGLAQSRADVQGIFEMDTHESFSFDIAGALLLTTSIEDDSVESAFAFGQLGLALLGSTPTQPLTLLDQLNVSAMLNGSDKDVVENNLFHLLLAGNPDNIIMQSVNVAQDLEGLNKFFAMNFRATYARQFNEPTQVLLLDFKAGEAGVQAVPAPSLLWGLLVYGVLSLTQRRRNN